MGKLKKWRGWSKWSLVALCLVAVLTMSATVGCSGKTTGTSNTSVALTPLQQLNANVTALTNRILALENSLTSLNALSPAIATINTNLTGLTNRVTTLEAINASGVNMSVYNAGIAALNANISMLTLRITALEAQPTPTPNASATPTPTPTAVATPTPTPTPCTVQKPTVSTPTNGNMAVASGSVMFQWTTCTGADHYEFWFGTDSASMTLRTNISAPVHFYAFPAPTADTYYYWKVVAVSSCGAKDMDAWWFKTSP